MFDTITFYVMLAILVGSVFGIGYMVGRNKR